MTTEGVDYSFQRPSPTNLKLGGKAFAMSYTGPGSGKFFTKAEIGALHAVGIAVVMLAERFPDSALSGHAEGVSQAQEADAMSFTWGLPADRPIYFAVDFDMQVSQRPAVLSFLEGVAAVIGHNRVGIYGGIRTTEWAAQNRYASWFFQTYAWSGTDLGPAANVYQYRNNQILGGANVDLDRSITVDFGQWPNAVAAVATAGADTAAPIVDTSSFDFTVDVASISDSLTSSAAAIAGAARSIDALRG